MNDNSYVDWKELSDIALIATIGQFVKHHRLGQNRSQNEVARAAGISRSTLSLLERGEKINLSSLIRVLRVLDLLYVMDAFTVKDEISPIAYAKLQKKKRQRARNGGEDQNEETTW